MSHKFFPEVSPQTYFPDGHETFYEGINRLAQEWFPDTWHGEDELRLRNQEYDEGVSEMSVAGTRILMAQTHSEAQIAEISDDEIIASLLSERTDQHKAELGAPLRYRDLVMELRKALVESKLSIAGLADDESDVPLPSEYWKGSLAERVLYNGTCTISNGSFIQRVNPCPLPVRFLIFNSESVDRLIAHRSPRPDLSKDKIFSDAVKWLSREMRKSPNYRPPEMSNKKAREKYNELYDKDIKERAWDEIWKVSIEAEGAYAWSKPGPSRKRGSVRGN